MEFFQILFPIIVGLITSICAHLKGYNPFLWFLGGGIIGLLILAFLPYVNGKSQLSEEQRLEKKKLGNIIGSILSLLALGLIVLLSI